MTDNKGVVNQSIKMLNDARRTNDIRHSTVHGPVGDGNAGRDLNSSNSWLYLFFFL